MLKKDSQKTLIIFIVTFLVLLTFSFRSPGVKNTREVFQRKKQEFQIEKEEEQYEIELAGYREERRILSDKDQAFEALKIYRLEEDEQEIIIYDEIAIAKSEFEIKKKEFLLERYFSELEKKKKENKEKPKSEQEKDKPFFLGIKNKIQNLQEELKKDKQYLQIKKEIVQDDGKVDLVYSWGGITQDMYIRNRYNYELQFSLRSVDKYFPWVNKIYLLINYDTTYPYWLKPQEELDKIVILDRCQFFDHPKDCPTKNSFAVYSIAHKIPGLSNKFVLIDDDFFFNQPVPEDYFFTSNNLPKVYQPRRHQRTYQRVDDLLDLAREREFPLWKYARYSHIPKSNRRDFILKFEEKYPSFLEFVQSHKVRHRHLAEDLSMIYFEFYYRENIMKELPVEESKFCQLSFHHEDDITEEFEQSYQKLTTEDIIVFNQNDNFSDDVQIYKKQRKVLWNFYNKLYPDSPDFEVPNPDHKANTEIVI
ncbi:hypothetical protein M0813_24221 [Anaeramoeba flamelloides]|uniref:Stealth protein CR2 conserved region 2 domain-containing protein n=1 Tax=Anaeramoeba flamelloides TaxID=1746091 RepID=A0ABQ8Y6Q9_9EUKA|nr:hypothetical protein M0813_24221 [Anaeramoeba flamelloides]